jgi:hypothetical protein
MKIVYGLLLMALAQTISFIQLQGQMAWKFPRENPYVMMLLGLPISLIFIKTTKMFFFRLSLNFTNSFLITLEIYIENISLSMRVCAMNK